MLSWLEAVCSCSQEFRQTDDVVSNNQDIITVDKNSAWPGSIFNIADLKHILFADVIPVKFFWHKKCLRISPLLVK